MDYLDDWPEWIRSTGGRQLSFVGFNNALGNRGTPSATRQMHSLQRNAGRCFYQWAVQVWFWTILLGLFGF